MIWVEWRLSLYPEPSRQGDVEETFRVSVTLVTSLSQPQETGCTLIEPFLHSPPSENSSGWKMKNLSQEF
jgi:hypothetical protein